LLQEVTRATLAGMTTLLELARKEHARLGQVIRLLEGTTPTTTPKTVPKKKGRPWTQAEKDAMSKKIKALNAAKRKAKA
jgi:hypothetical protein